MHSFSDNIYTYKQFVKDKFANITTKKTILQYNARGW